MWPAIRFLLRVRVLLFFGSGSQLPVSGRLAESVEFPHRQSQGNIGTGVVHGRYTPLTTLQTSISNAGGADPDVGTVFGADYSVNFNHNPIYKVGQEFPVTSTLYYRSGIHQCDGGCLQFRVGI